MPERLIAQAVAALSDFDLHGTLVEVAEHGSGNVNDTFVATVADASGATAKWLLQRLNTEIFTEPRLVMANLRTVADHCSGRLAAEPAGRRWEVVRPAVARNGGDWLEQADGSCWRLLTFIDRASCRERVTTVTEAEQIGVGLGRFHRLISDLPPASLHDTLPGFHVTPGYLARYQTVASRAIGKRSAAADRCASFIAAREKGSAVLEERRRAGILSERPIHGDPKASNVMLADSDGRAVGLVDLDTVKPGLVQYDIGDCLRSCCNPAGEEASDLAAVRFDTDCCQAILAGYLSEASAFLAPADYQSFFDAVRLIAFELGLRFFTDHLAGNVYFKAEHAEQNLQRALVQFRLTEAIERQERSIRAIVKELAWTS